MTSEQLKNLPRGKPKPIDIRTGSSKCFAVFKEQNPNINITLTQYRNILKKLNKYYLDFLFETGKKIVLPYGLGELLITKYKLSAKPRYDKDGNLYVKRAVNWGATKKEGVIVYHMNDHSDGYSYRFLWLKKNSKIPWAILWTNKMYGKVRVRLKNAILEGDGDIFREVNQSTHTALDPTVRKKFYVQD